MLSYHADQVLCKIKDRIDVENSHCVLLPWKQTDLKIPTIETSGSVNNSKVFSRCAGCLSDEDGQIFFYPGTSAVWLATKYSGFFDAHKSKKKDSDTVGTVRIWSDPEEEPLFQLDEDLLSPSVIIELTNDEEHWIQKLARFLEELPGEYFITMRSFDYDHVHHATTCLVHGIDEKPEVLLSDVLESVNGINTSCIHSLERCEGAWKGNYAVRLSPAIYI